MTSERERRLTSVERRIEALEARGAIESMHADFVRRVADRRFADLVNFFTEDAMIDMRAHGPRTGRAAIAEHFRNMVEAPVDGATYLLSSPAIEVDGDSASGQWSWHRLHRPATAPTGATGPTWEEGRYSCRYARVDDRWLFQTMRFRVVRPDPDPEGAQTP